MRLRTSDGATLRTNLKCGAFETMGELTHKSEEVLAHCHRAMRGHPGPCVRYRALPSTDRGARPFDFEQITQLSCYNSGVILAVRALILRSSLSSMLP
jgi:hypothetical protein